MGSERNRSAAMSWSLAAHAAVILAALAIPPSLPPIPSVPPPRARVVLIEPPKPVAVPPAPRAVERARLESLQVERERPAPVRVTAPAAPRVEVQSELSIELPLERPKLEAPPRPRAALAAATASAPLPEPSAVRAAGFEGVLVEASGPPRKAALNVGAFQGASGAPGGSPGAGRVAEVRQAGFGGALASNAAGKPGPTVASGGFGGSVAGGGPARAAVSIASAGFGDVHGEKVAASVERGTRRPQTKPVEIVSKPKPLYTPEARDRRIEGEVALQVRFGADGRIEVLKVLRGLGYGLEEAAARAVESMQFRPAERAGIPVDSVLSVAVAFRLAY